MSDDLMTGMPEKKVFTRAQEIIDAYGITRARFDKFIRMGMPARLIDNRWYAHRDNIDEWFRRLTAVSQPDAPENVG